MGIVAVVEKTVVSLPNQFPTERFVGNNDGQPAFESLNDYPAETFKTRAYQGGVGLYEVVVGV